MTIAKQTRPAHPQGASRRARSFLWTLGATAFLGMATLGTSSADEFASGNSVGSLPNVVSGGGGEVDRGPSPYFFVRLPEGLDLESIILDAWGSGGAAIVQESLGSTTVRRVEFYGDVHVILDRRSLDTPGVSYGVMAGEGGQMWAAFQLERALGSVGRFRSGTALALPLARMDSEGLFDAPLSVETLQQGVAPLGSARGSVRFEPVAAQLRIDQDQYR